MHDAREGQREFGASVCARVIYLGNLDCWLRDCALLGSMPPLVPAERLGWVSIGSRLRGHPAAVPAVFSVPPRGGPTSNIRGQEVPTSGKLGGATEQWSPLFQQTGKSVPYLRSSFRLRQNEREGHQREEGPRADPKAAIVARRISARSLACKSSRFLLCGLWMHDAFGPP